MKLKRLRSEDVVVTWGGANDISKNNTKIAIKRMCNLVKKKQGKCCDNEIVPQILSYTPSSCVSNVALNFNR